jgi:quercetin dioxygenase-like cupin family protein
MISTKTPARRHAGCETAVPAVTRRSRRRALKTSGFAVVVLSVTLGGGSTACRQVPDGRQPLPPPPPDTKPADYEPLLPFKEIAPNVLARTFYSSDEDAQYVVEARELAIPPGKAAQNLTMPGAAIFQVREGAAMVRVGDSTQSLGPGSALAVAQGASVTVENKSEEPLLFRVHVVRAK